MTAEPETLWKMDCSQCAVFLTRQTEDEANELRDRHKRDSGHNSAIVTKIQRVKW